MTGQSKKMLSYIRLIDVIYRWTLRQAEVNISWSKVIDNLAKIEQITNGLSINAIVQGMV